MEYRWDMLKAYSYGKPSRLILGLSHGNVHRFRESPLDSFILVRGKETGAPIDVLLFSGKTTKGMDDLFKPKVAPKSMVVMTNPVWHTRVWFNSRDTIVIGLTYNDLDLLEGKTLATDGEKFTVIELPCREINAPMHITLIGGETEEKIANALAVVESQHAVIH